MSMGFVGGSSFTVTADTAGFEAGLKRAQVDARRTHQVIAGEMGAMAASVTTKLDAVRRSAERANAGFGGMGKAGGRAGLGLLAIGNAVDDMQYGFRSVVNNIPQVVYMMGGSGGLAGGAAIAAVAINQLVQHWGQLMDSMQGAWLNVPADHLERIRIRADKAADAFGKLMAAPSKVEAKQIDALTDVMRGADKGGQRMVMKGLREAIQADPAMAPKLGPGDAVEIAKRMALKATGRAMKFQPVMGLKDLEAEVKKEMLQERLAQAVEQLIGQALLPGEEGVGARATIGRLVDKFKDAFTPKFRKAMAETTDDAVEHADANRAAARAMMGGPVGTGLLMGGGGAPRGPLNEAQARAMLRKNSLLRRLNPMASGDLARRLVGLSPEQADKVMEGLSPKAIQGHADKNFAGHIGRAAADLMMGRARAVREGGPLPPRPDATDKAIEAQLKAAGIEGDAPGVRREMLKIQEERIKGVMLERGVTKEQARFLVAQEQAQRRFPGLSGQPAQWVGAAAFAKMSAVGALNGPMSQLPDLATKQLKELTDIRVALQKMKLDLTAKAGP
jgi:hypothetical protein